MPVSKRTRDIGVTIPTVVDDHTWFRQRLQQFANETGETWILLDGFQSKMAGIASKSDLMHGVPKSVASSEEITKAIEEFKSQVTDRLDS